MLRKLLNSVQSLFNSNHATAERISCYHCGEKSAPSLTIYVLFDGNIRAVCCHGCAAILNTVEELGMRDEYLAHKIQNLYPDA